MITHNLGTWYFVVEIMYMLVTDFKLKETLKSLNGRFAEKAMRFARHIGDNKNEMTLSKENTCKCCVHLHIWSVNNIQ